jgi:hypothetical protein
VIWHKLEYMTIDILYIWESTAPEMSEYVYLELYNVKVVLRSVKIGVCVMLCFEWWHVTAH